MQLGCSLLLKISINEAEAQADIDSSVSCCSASVRIGAQLGCTPRD